MPQPFAKFLALDARSKFTFIKVYAMLGWYRAAILLTSFKRLSAGLDHFKEEPPRGKISAETSERARQLAYLVGAAARYTPWQSTCLTQVLTLQRLLAKEHIGGRFYLGVARESTSGELNAHAWLRCGEHIINGGRGHEQFSVVSTYSWLES